MQPWCSGVTQATGKATYCTTASSNACHSDPALEPEETDVRDRTRALTCTKLVLRLLLIEESDTINKLHAEYEWLRSEIKAGNSNPP